MGIPLEDVNKVIASFVERKVLPPEVHPVEEAVKRIYDAILFEELRFTSVEEMKEFEERLVSILQERLEKMKSTEHSSPTTTKEYRLTKDRAKNLIALTVAQHHCVGYYGPSAAEARERCISREYRVIYPDLAKKIDDFAEKDPEGFKKWLSELAVYWMGSASPESESSSSEKWRRVVPTLGLTESGSSVKIPPFVPSVSAEEIPMYTPAFLSAVKEAWKTKTTKTFWEWIIEPTIGGVNVTLRGAKTPHEFFPHHVIEKMVYDETRKVYVVH
jgi:hypothetical protein